MASFVTPPAPHDPTVPPAPGGQDTFSPEIPNAVRYNRWLIDTFRPFFGSSLLEVGFGHGSVRAHIGDGIRHVGVDLDAAVIAQAQRDHPDGTFVQADISTPDLKERLAPFVFDTVLCANVIEHLADDRVGVANLLEVLDPGGYLLLFAPALPALYNDLDRLAGHYRRYRRQDVARLIPAERALIRKLEYFNPIGAVGWWLNRFTRHDSLAAARVGRQVRLFDRYVLPVSRMLNGLTRAWLGQSVLCVAVRR